MNLSYITDYYTLDQLKKIVGVEPLEGSYSIGDMRGLKKHRVKTDNTALNMLLLEVEEGTIEDAMTRMIQKIEKSGVHKKAGAIRECKLELSIGVVYQTYTYTIRLSADSLSWLSCKDINLEICCYPGSGKE